MPAPGDDGYESSDVEGPETDAVGANAVYRGIARALTETQDQGTWKAKADYKRALDAVDKRARNIRHSLNSADGIVGDAAFWSQLRDTIQGDDFRQAVTYAETLTNELGEQRPAAEGTVSALQFDAMVKGYMTEHHTPNYLDVARDVLMETVCQADGETGAAYRLRELQQRYRIPLQGPLGRRTRAQGHVHGVRSRVDSWSPRHGSCGIAGREV